MEDSKKKEYVGINVPIEWKPYLDEVLAKVEIVKQLETINYTKTYSGLGKWIIREFLLDKTSFRFDHINVDYNYITFFDKKLMRSANVAVKRMGSIEFELKCDLCDSKNCEHVKQALKDREFMKPLEKRGLKYKRVE